jgi:hypothetical protein
MKLWIVQPLLQANNLGLLRTHKQFAEFIKGRGLPISGIYHSLVCLIFHGKFGQGANLSSLVINRRDFILSAQFST